MSLHLAQSHQRCIAMRWMLQVHFHSDNAIDGFGIGGGIYQQRSLSSSQLSCNVYSTLVMPQLACSNFTVRGYYLYKSNMAYSDLLPNVAIAVWSVFNSSALFAAMAGSQEPNMGHQKNVPLSAVTRHQEPRSRALNASIGTWLTAHCFCKIQQPQAAFATKVSQLLPCDIFTPSSTPISLSGSINCSLHIVPKTPIAPPCLAANLLGSTSIYIYPLDLSIFLTPSPLHTSLIHPVSSFFFSILPVLQTTPSTCLASLPFTSSLSPEPPLVLSWGKKPLLLSGAYGLGANETQYSSLSGLTATELGSAAIKGLSPLPMAATCIRI